MLINPPHWRSAGGSHSYSLTWVPGEGLSVGKNFGRLGFFGSTGYICLHCPVWMFGCGTLVRRRWSQPMQKKLSAHSREPSASDLLNFVPRQSCSTCMGGVIAQIWWAISTSRFYVLLICDKYVLQYLWPPNMSVEIWIFSWYMSSWGSMYSLTFAVGNV